MAGVEQKRGEASGRRIVSVWLPNWPTDRLYRRKVATGPRAQPLVLTAPRQGGVRVVALNQAARQERISVGQLLADARALCPDLLAEEWDPRGDETDLKRLSDWCGRYTPWTVPGVAGEGHSLAEGVDGIFLDISGCGHLFGGEELLVGDLLKRFAGLGVSARAGIACSVGAAWAAARFGQGRKAFSIVPEEQEARALSGLPLAALRLPPVLVDELGRLGLKKIKDLTTMARGPLVARFGPLVMRRLDQAVGVEPEPLSPDLPYVPFRARLIFAEGIGRLEDVAEGIARLAEDVSLLLTREGQGARQLALALFRVDGHVSTLTVGTGQPVRDGAHLARLFREKLDHLGDEFDAGYGIDVMSLSVLRHDTLAESQTGLSEELGGAEGAHDPQLGQLIDRLGNRLGCKRVVRSLPLHSHVPECASAMRPAMAANGQEIHEAWRDWQALSVHRPQQDFRPLRLFSRAEPVDVIAEIPDGPPRQFRWRRVLYQVARAEGPERIAPEWWRTARTQATRDYFRVEDREGKRFWLYRDGLYGREVTRPRWYVHGMFG